MKGENLKKLSMKANSFDIPIENFEKDMNAESAREKKNEILNLFTNFNNLCSEYDFNEIESKLHEACQKGDLELIKILLSETIINESKELKFKIDKTNKTASLFSVRLTKEKQLIIPRTVKDESDEYLITSISGTSSCVKTIKFVENSGVEKIYGNAFYCSYIEEIYFPASLKELKEGWCNDTNNLTKIAISPLNGQFKIKDEKYLLGKSDQNKDEFDILLFACRDIKQTIIPSNIKIISSYAFNYCKDLTKVEFEPNSNLQIIKSHAFFDCSKIEEIYIPSNVTKICDSAFYFCHSLRKVEFQQNSKIKTIESDVFLRIKMKEIYFPASLEELKEGWCKDTLNLTKISISPLNGQFKIKDDKYLIGKSDKNKDEFDILLFANRDIKQANIPSNIKIISSYAFEKCRNLTKVEIPTNSNLRTIKKCAFYECSNLRKVKIPKNSNLQAIESHAFNSSKIEEFFIPSKVSKICQLSFSNCPKIRKVEIPTNSELEIIESEAFFWSKVEEIFIPSKVSKICEGAFSNCSKLRKVEIPTNSNLQIIESDAFLWTKINELFIPAKVSKICEKAFSNCFFLQIIEISEDSILESFPLSAFPGCPNLIIMIPSSLKKLIHSNKPI